MSIVGNIVVFIVLLAIIHHFFRDKRKTEYDANFMNINERLSIWNKGYCLNGTHSETIMDSMRGAIVFGSSGNFKSVGITIPSILKMHRYSSLIINDPSSECRLKCARALHEAGVDVKTLNWNNPKLSEGYNPMKRIKTVSDRQKLAKLLVRSSMGSGSKDPFWNMSSESLISFGIGYIIQYTPPEQHTLSNVYHFISTMLHSPEKIDKMILKTEATIISEYKSFLSYGSKTLASIIATCRAALSIFATDPTIVAITSNDTLSFSDFKTKRTALFINTTIQDQKYYSVITSLFLEQFFAELMSELPSDDSQIPIFFLLEEASSLYWNELQILLANCRKYYCSILQIYQSKGQLVDLYGPALARSILDNSFAVVYQGGQSIQVSQELEATMGKFEFIDERNVRQVRPLMTASEIHELEESLIILGNNRVIKTRTKPYFRQYRLRQLTSLPPYQPESKLSLITPPLLQFD